MTALTVMQKKDIKILSIRSSNTDFACAVIEGTQEAPKLILCELTSFPKGYEEHSLLHWFYQEIAGKLSDHNPAFLAVKAAEPSVRRSNSLELRIRIEGVALMAAGEKGCEHACRKVKSTISKDLGMKGRAKYLETEFDPSALAEFGSLSAKEKEAVLAGWSCLD
jgi:hypothetical protein